jgi:hypothetical protein
MRIGVELNGVLRDTLGKFKQVYEKNLIDNVYDVAPEKQFNLDISGNTSDSITVEEMFKYEIKSDITSLDLISHFAFRNDDELYDFMYKEHTMEIFGHAGSIEISSMNDFNDFYIDLRERHDILIVSDEIGKSKPASLFFISKFGCLVETVKFYSESTIKSMWDSIDILLTANPNLLLNHPQNKIVIKYITPYNEGIKTEFEISKFKEFKTVIESIL